MTSIRETTRRNTIFGVILAAVLVVALPSLIIHGTPVRQNSNAQLMAWVMAAYAGFSLAIAFVNGSARPMRIGFSVFVYLFLGLAPLAQISEARWPLGDVPRNDLVISAGVIAIVGILAWEIGYLIVSVRKRSNSRPGVSDERWRTLAVVSVVLSSLFVLAVGAPTMFKSREYLENAVASAFGSVTSTGAIGFAVATVPAVVALLVVLRKREQGDDRLTGWVALLLATNIVISNPIANPRFWSGTVALAVFMAWGCRAGTPSRMRLLIVGWLSAFLLLFPVADAFRYTTDANRLEVANVKNTLQSGDFDAYQQIANGVGFVQSHEVQHGRQLVGATFVFVPRAIWPDKPNSTGVLLANASGYDFTNLSAPLWVEGYVDFGMVGVALFLGLLGAASAALDRRFAVAVITQNSEIWMIIVPLLAAYQILALRGALIIVLPRLLVMGVCWWFLASGLGQPRGKKAGQIPARTVRHGAIDEPAAGDFRY